MPRTLGKKARNRHGYRKDGSREMEKPGRWGLILFMFWMSQSARHLALSQRVEIRGYEDRYPQICTVLKRNEEGKWPSINRTIEN